MVVAWLFTVPAAGLIGASAEEMVAAFPSATVGVIVVSVITTAVLAVIFRIAHRTNVTADNVLDDLEVPSPGEALAPVVVVTP